MNSTPAAIPVRCASPFLITYSLTKVLNFDFMQAQVNIEFDQLVKIAKQLPSIQWTKLKEEVEASKPLDKERDEFRELLLSGPTFSKKQLDIVAETRKKIDEWRTK